MARFTNGTTCECLPPFMNSAGTANTHFSQSIQSHRIASSSDFRSPVSISNSKARALTVSLCRNARTKCGTSL